ncbi:uncharacterized protein LOC134234240 [Saccostrea cucullata]|uniref:uncharacterized protein LOC134234240 n=1 Tax=Saccostrea cuccullata TaxID=36930 RepID=UPI002ED297DB
MGSLKLLCLMLSISVYRAFCQIQLPAKASGESNVLPSTVSGRASNALRDILNQESLVRFAMVQKIQSVVIDAIDNKNDRQLMKAKLSVMTKDLKDLETKSQNMEAENNKLKEELKVMYGKVNDNRNFTKDVIQNLDQKMKSKTSALHDENLKQALKNLAYEKQLDLLNNTIKQMERSVGKDIETLKSSDMSTLERINTLNTSHAIEVIKNFQKVKELDDSFRNKSLVLENIDRGLTEGIEVLQDQMNEVNATLQISGVDVLARQIKKMEDTFSSFAVTVSEGTELSKFYISQNFQVTRQVFALHRSYIELF